MVTPHDFVHGAKSCTGSMSKGWSRGAVLLKAGQIH